MVERFTKPYLDALFDVAGGPDGVEALLPALSAFDALLGTSDDLRRLVQNPGIDRARKQKVVEEVAARSAVDGLALRFLTTLLHNRRLHKLSQVLSAIRERLDKERKTVEAVLRTAVPIGEKTKEQIRELLQKTTRTNVRLKAAVEPALIAGFVIQMGSEVYDASLAQRLAKTRAALHAV
jgi:F-type H+-transporting ATPase subunit delta